MEIYKTLQIPNVVKSGEELKSFEYKGKKYNILRESKNRDLISEDLPIGVWLTGFAAQYEAESEDGVKAEVFVYYYRKMEGEYMAIVDAIKFM